jgi:hypothetical protein
MIETARHVITKGAVEQLKESAPDTLREVSERFRESGVVHQLRKSRAARRRAAERAARGGVPPVVLVLAVLGVATIGVVLWRRRAARREEIAPDAFGSAVRKEQKASAFGHRPVATPGA